MKNNSNVSAIIVAAGESRRMKGVDKIAVPLGGVPSLIRVIDVFEICKAVDRIVVVGRKAIAPMAQMKLRLEGPEAKFNEFYIGGKRRQDSVKEGLHYLETPFLEGMEKLKASDWVIIHDGARPLITKELIERGLEAAQETGAAAAAVPVTDTIKVAGDDRIVLQTPSRQNLWAVQTPQVFRFDIITEAYKKATGEATDDASLVEQAGYKVKLYMGSYDNIKITTPDDLLIVEAFLAEDSRQHGD